MRLCYIASGISIHTERWVNHFARRGHEVHLIASQFTEGYEGFDSSIQMHSLVKLFPRIWTVSGYFSGILWLFQIRRLVKQIKPHILHAHYIGVPAYLGVASGFHPLVLSAWGSDILITPKKNPVRGFLTRQALKRADRIICVSSALEEEIVKLGGAPDKVEMTPLGIDTQEFSPGLRSEELLRELGIADSPVVISTRSLNPIYDVETLIKSIPLVLQEIPEARFIIAGEGQQRTHLEGLARSSGVLDSIRFIGWIPHTELPRYLASSDVYVSTSLSDGTSISLLEALACELAPVVTDIPANQAWIDDEENGFLVPVRNHKMLAERIVLLLKNSETRTRFGKTCRNIVMERAEHENEMSRITRMYEELRRAKLGDGSES